MSSDQRYWAVIPAAGIGSRMGSDIPKQYLKLRKKCILEYVLERFCNHPNIEKVIVALANGDRYWESLTIASHPKIKTVEGGIERCHSVVNGLRALDGMAEADDWVLVHDAARPCIRRDDIDQLIHSLEEHSVGGILAVPARDTMKRSGKKNEIRETVERNGLWHALTPQMFRLAILKGALEKVLEKNSLVTDEAQAVEMSGLQPLLIAGHADNIKVTQPEDLPLAEFFISQQEKSL